MDDAILVRVTNDTSSNVAWNVPYFSADVYMKHFVAKYVCTHKTAITLIKNMSNLYVLVGRKISEQSLSKGEKPWSDLLANTPDLMKEIYDHGCCPLAMMLISRNERSDESYYIEWIESFFPRYKIATRLIRKVDAYLDMQGFPVDISETAQYWSDHFFHSFDDLAEVMAFCKEHDVDETRLIGYDLLFKDKKRRTNDDDDDE